MIYIFFWGSLALSVAFPVSAECALAAAVNDAGSPTCEVEDDVSLTDMSLLQTDVQLHNELPKAKQAAKIHDRMPAPPEVHHHHHHHAPGQPVPWSRGAVRDNALALESSAVKMPSSSVSVMARAIVMANVWAYRLTDKNTVIGSTATIWLMLFGLLGFALFVMLILSLLDHRPAKSPPRDTGQDSRAQASPLVGNYQGQPPSVASQPVVVATEAAKGSRGLGSQVSVPVPDLETVATPPIPPPEVEALPAICPSLILPHTEARFMIQMDSLKSLSTEGISILGTSGRTLLHARVCKTPDDRNLLALSSCGCEDDPRTCILTPQTAESQAFEIFGKAGKFYGYLDFPGGKKALLQWCGGVGGVKQPVMQIELGACTDFCMTASAMDGRTLASAGSNVGSRPGEGSGDSWKVNVKPGVDAVLITSSMLALILLRPWPAAGTTSSLFSPSGTGTSLQPRTTPLPPRRWP